ncbi:MAG: VOC family protein [Chloroflexi bacterium]|nr:VOC family protein [Chloroflexota bacterium]
MSNQPKFGFLLEYVTDIEAVKRFYVEVLGFEVERAHPVFVQFKDHFAIASDESLSGTRDPEVYWLVDDAEAAFDDLSRKTETIFPIKQMPFGKVFSIKDPAGQPLYLLEFARERPSQPVK